MYGGDPDDDWSRLLQALRARREELAQDVCGGECNPSQYQNVCGRIAQIDETIELARRVRRGEDRPQPVLEVRRTVED